MAETRDIQEILATVAERVAKIDGVAAIVLGGSRARGTADEQSDIDVGIYYVASQPFAIGDLAAAAQELDDRQLPEIVTGFGEWGAGVNGGGWLQVRGRRVDFLYRELGAVARAIEDCVNGRPSSVYQLGHPLGFPNQIYAGEIAVCRPLADDTGAIAELKGRVAEYPEALREAIARKHLFDAAFEIGICDQPAERGDVMYVTGCLFRAAGFMTMVVYALNRRWWLNEKGALRESRGFAIQPAGFHDTIAAVLGNVGQRPAQLRASMARFQHLVERMRELAA